MSQFRSKAARTKRTSDQSRHQASWPGDLRKSSWAISQHPVAGMRSDRSFDSWRGIKLAQLPRIVVCANRKLAADLRRVCSMPM